MTILKTDCHGYLKFIILLYKQQIAIVYCKFVESVEMYFFFIYYWPRFHRWFSVNEIH